MTSAIYEKYKGVTPIFVDFLNAAILFFSDFLKNYPDQYEIKFIQLSSYQDTNFRGKVNIYPVVL